MRFCSMMGSLACQRIPHTGARLIGLWLGALVFAISCPAQAEPPTCSQVAEPAGRGMLITRICTANSPGFSNTYDAYYRVSVSVTAGPGFANQARFRERSTEGQILAGLLNLFTNSERVTNVDIGVAIRQGSYQYPVRPLLQFRKTNDNEWTSFIRGDARSFLHRLDSGPFYITISYSYSRTSTMDLTVGSSFLQSAGINLVTPAVEPIFSAVNRVTSSIVSAGNITSESGTEQLLSPALGDKVELVFQVAGPRSTLPIATIRVRLEGTRSMMVPEPRPHAEIQATLPSGRIQDQTVASLSRQIATGPAQSWDVTNVALATVPLATVPLGREATAADLRALCSTIEGKLQTDYTLTSFDNLMVRARLINRAAEPVRARINPFPLCFEAADDRSLIRTHLGYDTEYSVVPPPPPLAPFSDADALYRFGCLFTGQLGPNCSAADATPERISQSLDEAIEVPALEGIVDEQVYANLPSNRTIGPANFQQRFGNQFAHFRAISGASGTMQLQESEGGPWLTLLAERGPNGKLRRITIRR